MNPTYTLGKLLYMHCTQIVECPMVRRVRLFATVLSGLLLFWIICTILVVSISQSFLNAYDSKVQKESEDSTDDYIRRGVQIIVGHYNGKIPDQNKKVNLSEEEINANNYSPESQLGEMGRPVRLDPKDEIVAKNLFSINQFNIVVSDKVFLNRTLPDVRKLQCREKVYDVDSLPTTSVIIVFHNEAWSTLLRTVTSVINRSPPLLLKEIILVDDKSSRTFLGEPLERYIAQLNTNVRLIRAVRRVGLIRARLIGAKESTGDVLTFLDSHCEVTPGWLEPLLHRIGEDRKVAVCPVIDVINDQTLAYQKGIELFRGGFNWNLQFRWYSSPSTELKRRNGDFTAPIRSPTMAGGLFSIHKEYFEQIGSYDSQMDIWGGENLELSFRIWLCGGSIEILPCSHVGHIFRKASPHDFPDKNSGTILNSNLVRAAEVWMNDWKYLFYKTSPQALELSKTTDVSERLALKDKLGCRDFRWFLTSVWPDHSLPMDDSFFGRLSCGINSQDRKLCLNSLNEIERKRRSLKLSQCTLGFDLWQLWILTREGYVKTDEHLCLMALVIGDSWVVQLKECAQSRAEIWIYNRKGTTRIGNMDQELMKKDHYRVYELYQF